MTVTAHELVPSVRTVDKPTLLETMMFRPGSGFGHLSRHLDRMEASAGDLGHRFDRRDVGRELHAFASRTSRPQRIRLTVSGEGEISVVGSDPPPVTGPVALTIDSVPVDARDEDLRHKTTDRGRYEACRARHPQFDDVIMINQDGHLTETTIANLVVELDGVWVTPPLASGCLPGVGRAALLGRHHVLERNVTIDELSRATALRLVSSLRGVRSAHLHRPPGDAHLRS